MTTVVRDAVWGDVPLGPRELALIDTPAFQRLRRVKQLGFTDLVFPGAHHTRFEHSIGVFHLARLLLDRLRALRDTPAIDEEAGLAFLAAALLHDVGHYPFSHAVEELEVDAIRRHERIARDRIQAEPLSSILADLWAVDPRRVADFVAGPGPGSGEPGEAEALLRRALDSGLDVDKLDYLVRDARGANVPYGQVDVQRLIGSLAVWRDADGRPDLAVTHKGVSALQSLVFAKHLMFATVYWHHACRAAVVMLLRAVQEALTAEALLPAELESCDDGGLLAKLGEPRMPQRTRALAAALLDRRLYKRALEVGVDDTGFAALERLWFRPRERAIVEDQWAETIGAPPGDVLLDVPEPRRIAVDLPVIVQRGQASEWDRVSGLSTGDLDRFQKWVRKIRVFAADAVAAERLSEEIRLQA